MTSTSIWSDCPFLGGGFCFVSRSFVQRVMSRFRHSLPSVKNFCLFLYEVTETFSYLIFPFFISYQKHVNPR